MPNLRWQAWKRWRLIICYLLASSLPVSYYEKNPCSAGKKKCETLERDEWGKTWRSWLSQTNGSVCDAREVQVLFGSGFFTKLASSFVKNTKSPRFARFYMFKRTKIHKTCIKFCFCWRFLSTVSIGLNVSNINLFWPLPIMWNSELTRLTFSTCTRSLTSDIWIGSHHTAHSRNVQTGEVSWEVVSSDVWHQHSTASRVSIHTVLVGLSLASLRRIIPHTVCLHSTTASSVCLRWRSSFVAVSYFLSVNASRLRHSLIDRST